MTKDMHTPITSLALGFLILLAGVVKVTYAEDGILWIQVVDVRGRPIPNVRLKLAGAGSTPLPTDLTGRTRIQLQPYTKPGDQVLLQVASEGGQDWVLVSPWNGLIVVPSFSNNTRNVVSIVIAKRGEAKALTKFEALTVSTKKVKKYALVIGIRGYPNFPDNEKLNYADEDAKAFAAFIQTPEGGAFPKNNIRLLINESAQRSAILREIRLLGREVGNEDLIYIYFAGHGLVDDYSQAYFMPYESEKSSPSEKGIRADHFLQELRTKITSKYMAVFVDACYAAAALMPDGTARGDANITSELLELWDKAFSRREGVSMGIFSASSNERSWEDDDLKHGLFTFYLLEGLRGNADSDEDGIVNAQELYKYVTDNVERRSRERFSVQTPVKTPQFDSNFPLALNKALLTSERSHTSADSQPSGGDDKVCQAITKIVEASRHDFSTLIDKATVQGLPESAASVPGFTSLSVSPGMTAIFSRTLRNMSEVEAEYHELISQLDQCFPRWEQMRFPEGRDGEGIRYRRHVLSEGEEGPALEASYSLAPPKAVVTLTIFSPKSGTLKLMRTLRKK